MGLYIFWLYGWHCSRLLFIDRGPHISMLDVASHLGRALDGFVSTPGLPPDMVLAALL